MNEICGARIKGKSSFFILLLRAVQRMEARVESVLGESGLSLAKLGVLNHLVESGESLPLGHLAGRISCVKSNMTQIIDRLEKDGLVERVADSEDRRSVRAAITTEGRRRYAMGAQILAEQERVLFKELTAAELKHISGLLQRINNS